MASEDATPKVVAAAEAFLKTLDDSQRGKVSFSMDDATQRANWSNLPTGLYQRAGLRFGDLSQAQRDAALAMVAATLSPSGYQQVLDVVNGDEVLRTTDGGGNLIFGSAEYYVSILGTPSAATPWMWQFGGHHLAINATIAGSNITLAPSLTGGQPLQYSLNGADIRTVGAELDAAFAFIQSLDSTQQQQAVIGSRFTDLVLGPGKDGQTLQPEGLNAASLSVEQKILLLQLIRARVGILNDEDAAVKLAEVEAGIADTYVAWSGPTTTGSAAYFRIQGPRLFIEYSPQQMGGSATNHTHAIYRDPANDYGALWRAQ